MLLYNVLITIVWCWLQGNFSAANIVGGFVLGFGTLWLLSSRDLIQGRSYIRQVPQVLSLIIYFLWELLVANFRLAVDLITPGHKNTPAIIAMPLEAKTDAEITILAALITLTPGTLSMDVSEDRSILYIHALYVDDEQELIHSLKHGFERKLLEVLR